MLAVAVGESSDQVLENVRSMINRAQIKRFILLYSHVNDPVIDLLKSASVEFVTVGKPAAGQDWLYVDNDNVEAGADGTRYLMKKLHVSTPVFAESTNDWPYEVDRKTGYLREMSLAKKSPVVFFPFLITMIRL